MLRFNTIDHSFNELKKYGFKTPSELKALYPNELADFLKDYEVDSGTKLNNISYIYIPMIPKGPASDEITPYMANNAKRPAWFIEIFPNDGSISFDVTVSDSDIEKEAFPDGSLLAHVDTEGFLLMAQLLQDNFFYFSAGEMDSQSHPVDEVAETKEAISQSSFYHIWMKDD